MNVNKNIVSGLTILSIFSGSFALEIKNPLIKKLYEKGILTKEEALELDKREKERLIKHTTVINNNSPQFLLGKETYPNMIIRPFDNPDMYVKLGLRLQAIFENYKVDYNDPEKEDENTWDAYLRRLRLEFGVGFSKHVHFKMDIRNDKADKKDEGGGFFKVGDAYLKIKRPFGTSLINFKLFRAKIDVARVETIKSAWLIYFDRPHVADSAAEFIAHGRRATNAQIYGDWKKKIHYQIAVGDATYSGKFFDAKGQDLDEIGGKIKEQDFFYGGKIRISPIPGWEEKKRSETYFGVGKHISAGIGYWKVPHIKYTDNSGTHSISRRLINYEFSAHYKGAFIEYEYFDFDGIEKDFTDTVFQLGKSKGWYITGEYVFPQLYYIAPFARYEEWDRWDGEGDYKLKSTIFGLNWYLRGNTTRVGIAYHKDDYGKEIGDKEITHIRLTSQFLF